MRNALAQVPKTAAELVAATGTRAQCQQVADILRSWFARLAELLDEARDNVLAYVAFPNEHWRQIWSNNPLERVNR